MISVKYDRCFSQLGEWKKRRKSARFDNLQDRFDDLLFVIT